MCMIDSTGKLFERLIRTRVIVESGRGLTENQYGFCVGRSTVMAADEEDVKQAWSGLHKSRDACLLVTLDVKNALNLARWEDILTFLRRKRFPE